MTCVLLSGGLDSAVCLALCPRASALFVDYGQPHRDREAVAAEAVARYYGLKLHRARVAVPAVIDHGDPAMLIPGRNLMLISLAAMLGRSVVIGANAEDWEVYEDCRPAFFNAVSRLVRISTPLLYLAKPEIGRLALDLRVPFELTWSCYYPAPDDGPCGRCDACQARERALA